MEVITMSTKNQSSLFHQTFIKDASSFVIPVLIVLMALIFAAGNRYSVQAAESPAPAHSPSVVTVSGSAGVVVSGGSGTVIP
jgi:hypothetical protein